MYVHSDTIQCGVWRRVRRRPNGSDIYCDMKEELQTEAVTPTNAIDINTISDPIEVVLVIVTVIIVTITIITVTINRLKS